MANDIYSLYLTFRKNSLYKINTSFLGMKKARKECQIVMMSRFVSELHEGFLRHSEDQPFEDRKYPRGLFRGRSTRKCR
jgi:hypothetical protein